MSDAKSGAEKRVSKRVDASLSVDYSTYSPYHLRRITNISRGGVFIRTQDIFPIGTTIDISFKVPTIERTIQAKVKVCWTYRQPATVQMNSSGMGVQFVDIQEADLNAIIDYIANAS